MRCRICGRYCKKGQLICSKKCEKKAIREDIEFSEHLKMEAKSGYQDFLEWKKESQKTVSIDEFIDEDIEIDNIDNFDE